MSKFTPVADILVIEPIRRSEHIVLIDGQEATPGDSFLVLDAGPGCYNEVSGGVAPMSVKPGDEVYIVGKILQVPFKDGKLLIARESNVIGYIRKEEDA